MTFSPKSRIGRSHGDSNACLALPGLGVILAVVLLPPGTGLPNSRTQPPSLSPRRSHRGTPFPWPDQLLAGGNTCFRIVGPIAVAKGYASSG
jgi:hypothetical protein